MIRTLITDDSQLVRTIIKDFLESDGSFQIVGEAENGKESVEKVKSLSPDLVTMDYEMPVMNGLDAIVEIRKFSKCAIVVVSTHDTAKMAYDATVKGAQEFFAKDLFTSHKDTDRSAEIYETLKEIVKSKKIITTDFVSKKESGAGRKIEAVVVAASTGGPMALCQICSNLPKSFPIPLFLVQHNTSGFDRGFVQWLNEYSHLNVFLGEEGTVPSKGCIYVAPTERHLIVKDNLIKIDDGDLKNNQKPSADVLFKSASELYGSSLVSIVLTGMGNDGAEGTSIVKKAGGITIAQDESTSMIFGMPQSAIETGCVDFVLPLNEIVNKLVSIVGMEN